MGVDAIEIAAINSGNDYFIRFPYVDVDTHNESVYNKVRNSYAKRLVHVREQCERVTAAVAKSLSDGYHPLVLSGDHSSALGTMSGIKQQLQEKTLGVVWIDAHADLHSPYTSPSGNIHGMPLAAALGENNLEDRINEVTEGTVQEWEQMHNLGYAGPKIRPEHLVFFGVRDTEAPEDHLMARNNIRNYKVHEMRYRGFETCLKEALEQLAECDALYISFDVDSMDCDLVSRGTGTPVSKGFDPDEIIQIIQTLLGSGKVACLECTEVNPLLDTKGNKMAETAFYVLDAVTKTWLEQLA
jgi:arginase